MTPVFYRNGGVDFYSYIAISLIIGYFLFNIYELFHEIYFISICKLSNSIISISIFCFMNITYILVLNNLLQIRSFFVINVIVNVLISKFMLKVLCNYVFSIVFE